MDNADKIAADLVCNAACSDPEHQRWRKLISEAIRTAIAADRQRVSGAVREYLAAEERCEELRNRLRFNSEWDNAIEAVSMARTRVRALLDGDGGRAEKVERVVEAARSAAEKLDAEVCAYIGISSRLHMERALDAAEELRAAVKALDGEGGEGR